MKSLFVGILLSLVAVSSVHADKLADDLVNNLYAMKAVYRAEYAPSTWKKTFANYDLETEFSKAVAAAQAKPNMNLKDARDILKNFIYAMKDYHTSIRFVSTEQAKLPFTVKGAQGRYFFSFIDRSKLPETSFPFKVGDELVTFGGKPVAQAVAEVQAETPANVPTTDEDLATQITLTNRRAARGYHVPIGPITISAKNQGTTDVKEYELIWDYTPERIFARNDLSNYQDALSQTVKAPIFSIFRPHMDVKLADSTSGDNPNDLGARKTFTPDLGTKIWESADKDFYYAYIYKGPNGKTVGYVRIASYEADDYVKAVTEFSQLMTRFESTADALVIDEVNNPGGSVFYLYTLASMLATQPLKTPLHRMSITQDDVMQALQSIDKLQSVKTDDDAKKLLDPKDLDGYPPSYEFVQFNLRYSNFLVDQWNAGHKRTDPFWIAGVNHINPSVTHFSKPILLLVNHLDFSGGDFFPAILQDNKRVTVMGSRTSGAGGYVNDIKLSNNIGVDVFRCTESIAERVNLNPIENLGITPDVAYDITPDDLAQNYAPYVKAVNDEVLKLTTK